MRFLQYFQQWELHFQGGQPHGSCLSFGTGQAGGDQVNVLPQDLRQQNAASPAAPAEIPLGHAHQV